LIISLIVAMDRRRGIGYENKLPWRLPADLKRFRELTMGHHLIVGRRTWESLGKLLPGRHMIILTHDRNLSVAGAAVVHCLGDALKVARTHDDREAFIGGGADVYAQALPIADRIYLTLVDGEFQADTFFPEIDPRRWEETSSQSFTRDEKNLFEYTFKLLERAAAPEERHHATNSDVAPGM
jgi:dihydrofolate reductase